MDKIIKDRIDIIEEICKKYKVKNLYTFGSIGKKEFNENSDLDFLINFEKNISLEEYADNYFLLVD